jgi:hypothetical protein
MIMKKPKTDREISAALHEKMTQQSLALHRLALHTPYGYLQDILQTAATMLQAANQAWQEEEERAGAPLWR